MAAPTSNASNEETSDNEALDRLSFNTIRALSLDTVQRAESAQPGLPLDDGFVACDDGGAREFKGHHSGAAFCYEYADGGRTMSGRIYYLYADKHTVYALHFRAALEKLPALREQMDRIARSFRVR